MPSKVEDVAVAVHELPSESNTVVVPATTQHTHTVIFLGDTDCYKSAAGLADQLFGKQAANYSHLSDSLPSVKWIFLDPLHQSIVQHGSKTVDVSWFDLWDGQNPQERQDLQVDGLRDSITYILDVIRNETAVIPPERIIIGGMSQGCAAAIHTLLYGGIRLGGFIGLSGWLPFQDDIEVKARYSSSDCTLLKNIRKIFKSTNSKAIMPLSLKEEFPESDLAFKTPIFLSHSIGDTVVPFKNGDMLCWRLEEVLGFDVDWRVYQDSNHEVIAPHLVDDLVSFLHNVVQV